MPSRDDDDDRDDDRDDRDDDRSRRRRRRRDDDDDYDPRPAAPADKGNAGGLALSIVGLVLGTCALLFSFIPCLGYLAIYPGAVAIIISLVGLFISTRSKGLPLTALVVSVLSVGIAFWQGVRVEEVGKDLKKGAEQFGKDFQKGADQMQKEADRLEKERLEREKKANQNKVGN